MSALPKIAATRGLIRFSTSEVTIAPNAAPMTTATARSRTFPRMMNSLKPLSMWLPPRNGGCTREKVGPQGCQGEGPRRRRPHLVPRRLHWVIGGDPGDQLVSGVRATVIRELVLAWASRVAVSGVA